MSKRLLKDIKAVNEDTEWNFKAIFNEADLTQLRGQFPGPKDSPYQGGQFVVHMKVPNEYPLKPPVVRFETAVYHPNVSSQTGAICLDILKDAWTPVYNIKSILISLQQLLDSPNASDPQDAEVAGIYMNEPERFKTTAREWTRKYAAAAAAPEIDPATIDTFVQMGFSPDAIIAAMTKLDMTEAPDQDAQNRVVEALLSA